MVLRLSLGDLFAEVGLLIRRVQLPRQGPKTTWDRAPSPLGPSLELVVDTLTNAPSRALVPTSIYLALSVYTIFSTSLPLIHARIRSNTPGGPQVELPGERIGESRLLSVLFVSTRRGLTLSLPSLHPQINSSSKPRISFTSSTQSSSEPTSTPKGSRSSRNSPSRGARRRTAPNSRSRSTSKRRRREGRSQQPRSSKPNLPLLEIRCRSSPPAATRTEEEETALSLPLQKSLSTAQLELEPLTIDPSPKDDLSRTETLLPRRSTMERSRFRGWDPTQRRRRDLRTASSTSKGIDLARGR
ncbi:hypothetical protein BDY24DRAFT_383595 [Mrakia frigida]|uniref:uncharacterized protein n=1 Tax=Mrakia frigida TaxID=29902 RepID=UPI003FCC153B